MASFLIAPLRVELLHLTAPYAAVEAAFDPASLPRSVAGRDLNPDTAFLGDEVASPPFQNRNLVLFPGIHLHWQMPRDLTRSQHDPTGQRKAGIHPRLPNRWLISRIIGSPTRWIVESDFLHPPDGARPPEATAYPIVRPGSKMARDQPFRYLGRTLPLDDWLAVGNQGEYLEDGLTVMGYGNPAFAAFAPDCRGVFTFHDRETPSADGASYSVVGFYSNPAEAPSLAGVFALRASSQKPRSAILCIGRTTFRGSDAEGSELSSTLLHPKAARRRRLSARRAPTAVAPPATPIAVGNSATEALCAFLADAFRADPKAAALLSPAHDKAAIEAQLEAILMAADLDHRLQDQHPKFLEGRHAKGFTAFHGGMRWLIKPEAPAPAAAPAEEGKTIRGSSGPPIPPECITPLHNLNLYQRELEKRQGTRRTLLDRLSSDWHKYMLCAYPPPASRDAFPEADKVAHLIKSTTVKTIRRVDAEIREITEKRDAAAAEIETLLSRSHGPKSDTMVLRLKTIPGPRFWAPNDPVVVLAAPPELARHLPGAEARVHHSEAANWPEIELPRIPELSLWDILEYHVVAKFAGASNHGDRARHDDPARPIFVEWSARLLSPETDFANHHEHFDPHYVSSRFAPAANSPDLRPRVPRDDDAAPDEDDEESAYTGRSLVSAHAAQVLHERLRAFLNQQLGGAPELRDEDDDDPVVQRLMAAGTWDQPLTRIALWAREFLKRTKILCLPLGGFNDVLLMRRQTVQLPIAEPIGFREYQKFSEELRALVGELPTRAPVPLARFSPIRNGELQLDRIRLIDSFGRAYDVAVARDAIIASEPLRGNPVAFPPRFVQPLRVDFRWASAAHAEMDAHSHPDTTPICGWLLPNRLDESIAVYDANGRGIGSIDVDGLWRPAPGDEHPIVPRDIENPHLRRVILHLLTQTRDGEYLGAFQQTLNDALDATDPDSFAAHPALSLLIGRPIAVVRAAVKFELLGEPAEDHSWELLAAQIAGEKVHRSRRFEDVKIPFRIGEHQMLNDGVVGYWVEDGADGFANDVFHAPQTEESRHKNIASHHEQSLGSDAPEAQAMVLKAAPSAPPLLLTLLMDPRGAAHLTCGVLPVKEIRLAEHHFAAALKNISVTFLATPLLMLEGRTEITLPGEPGYAWSFLDRTPQGWRETLAPDITPPELGAAFRAGLTLREGWLRLEPKEDALEVPQPSPQPQPPTPT